jgi:uncharacterized protein
MKYGIKENDLINIVQILKSNRKIEEAILFGSRAKGNFENGSDIDIALKGQDLNINDIIGLQIKIDDLNLLYKFDLIIFNRINEQALFEHIERVGINLY